MTTQTRLQRLLECAALTPALHSLLLLDATYDALQQSAVFLQQLLETYFEHQVEVINLSASESEAALFGTYGLDAAQDHAPLRWQGGALDQSADAPATVRLLVIPDLTQLSIETARACVALLGADVAHLERHGQSRAWHPKLFWLAACPRSALGQLSPHLLDRFALRADASQLAAVRGIEELQRALCGDKPDTLFEISEQSALAASFAPPVVSAAALQQVLSYFKGNLDVSMRRPISLAWLALACARRRGATEVTLDHVKDAAQLIGVGALPPSPAPARDEPKQADAAPPSPAPGPVSADDKSQEGSAQKKDKPDDVGTGDGTAQKPPSPHPTAVQEGETKIVTSDGTALPALVYPEDDATPERELHSLRFPAQQRRANRDQRGVVIGVRRAYELVDLAFCATLLEAAKWHAWRQPERRKESKTKRAGSAGSDQTLRLRHEDLRRYRRTPPPERLLVLVLDYTCLDDWKDWSAAVLPYLQDAYVERSAITLIQVGAAKPEHPLAAQRIEARSLLAPAIGEALGQASGRATPLAHGLELARETLHHALQHGRSTVVKARLVVVTDGRGNVPLESSRSRSIVSPINKRGVESALEVAAQIRTLSNVDHPTLSRVETILIHPGSPYYPELPLELGAALKAKVRAPKSWGGG